MTTPYLQIKWAHFQLSQVEGIRYFQIIQPEKRMFAGSAIYILQAGTLAKPYSKEINTIYPNILYSLES